MLGMLCGPAVIYCSLGIVHILKSGVMVKWEGTLRVCQGSIDNTQYYVNHQCVGTDEEICTCR